MIRLLAAAVVVVLSAGVAHAADKRDPLKDLEQPATGRDIRVQITAANAATIGAPMSGRLAQFPLKDGDRFKEGQVLARFDCGVPEGALARARAAQDKKRKIYEVQDKQRQLGANSALDYEVAAAEAREAAAEVTAAQAVVNRCTVTAPYAGRVAAVMAREYQHAGEGSPLLDILSDRNLELELIVPSRWLGWLKVGAKFEVAIEETGKTARAELIRMSGKVDAVSQSIKVYARILDPGDDLLPGMSGRALLSPPG